MSKSRFIEQKLPHCGAEFLQPHLKVRLEEFSNVETNCRTAALNSSNLKVRLEELSAAVRQFLKVRLEEFSAAVRQFLSLRYVMTSNVPFEKNMMASTLAAAVITT